MKPKIRISIGNISYRVYALGSHAREQSAFEGHAVLNTTKLNELRAPDRPPYKAARSGEQDRLVSHHGSGSSLIAFIVGHIRDGRHLLAWRHLDA